MKEKKQEVMWMAKTIRGNVLLPYSCRINKKGVHLGMQQGGWSRLQYVVVKVFIKEAEEKIG